MAFRAKIARWTMHWPPSSRFTSIRAPAYDLDAILFARPRSCTFASLLDDPAKGRRREGKTCKKGAPEASAATAILQQRHDHATHQSPSLDGVPRGG
jgi:hypothetical protein